MLYDFDSKIKIITMGKQFYLMFCVLYAFQCQSRDYVQIDGAATLSTQEYKLSAMIQIYLC